MAKRVPSPYLTRTFAITLEGAPPGLSEDTLRSLIEDAVRDVGGASTVVSTSAATKPAKLRNRNLRKTGGIPCTRTATIGGKTIVGCGRVFATAKGYTLHMDDVAGTFSDTRRWPNHCLDAILPDELRDDR